MLGCNIGSNGVVVDSIGIPDQRYLEIVSVEAANTIEPGRPDLVSLYARPVSDFPGTLGGIGGVPTRIYYNTQSANGEIREYRLAGTLLAGNSFNPGYFWSKTYTNRSTMDKEIVEGVYQFKFPQLNFPSRSIYLSFPVRNTVEGYTTKPIKQGFKFENLPPVSSDGFYEFTEDEIIKFQWSGLSPNLVMNSDKLYISFRALEAGSEGDPNANADIFAFPAYAFQRIRLLSPVQSEYTIPATLLRNVLDSRIAIGAQFPAPPAIPPARLNEYFAEVSLERDPGVGIGIVSSRLFQLPIRIVASFPGSMAAAFPEGTSASSLAKDADPDGDGISNWVEWLSGTDPAQSNAPKTLSGLSFVPPSLAKDGEPTSGYWQMTLDRPTNLTSKAKASITVESSTDLQNWAVISDDPEWEIINNPKEPQLVVRSKNAALAEKRYFRARYTYTGN